MHPLEMYGVIASLLDRIETYFRGLSGKVDRIYRNNLKFHSLMVLAWTLNGGKAMPAPAIRKLDPKQATEAQIKKVVDWVFAEFKAAGPEDRTAKDSAFTKRLQQNWKLADTKV